MSSIKYNHCEKKRGGKMYKKAINMFIGSQ